MQGKFTKPGRDSSKARTLSAGQRTVVLAALGNFGRDSVLPHWNSCFREDDDPGLIPTAMSALGSFGTVEDIDALCHLAGARGERSEHDPSKKVCDGFEHATASIMARDHRTFDHLEHTWTRLPGEWWDEVIRAVGASRDAAGLPLLASMLRMAPGHQRLIAAQIPLLGASNDPHVNGLVAQELAPQLSSESKADVQTVALALGSLEQFEVVEQLIELLSDERPGVAQSAHRALCILTNKSISPSPLIWRKWHRQELAWKLDGKDAALERVSSARGETLRSTLREISRHRLQRHELALEVSRALHAPGESNRVLAARVLADLGSRWAAPALIEALDDSSESVRTSAHQALVSVTGTDLGERTDDWQSFSAPLSFH